MASVGDGADPAPWTMIAIHTWPKLGDWDVPFAEVLPLAAVVRDLHTAGRMVDHVEVFVLHDQDDPKHRGVLQLLQQWLLQVVYRINISVHGLGVGVGEIGAPISALDERLATPAEQDRGWSQEQIWRAETEFQSAALKQMVPAGRNIRVFVNGKSGSTVAKNLLQSCAQLSPAQLVLGVRRVNGGNNAGRLSARSTYDIRSEPSHSRMQHLFGRAVQVSCGAKVSDDDVQQIIGAEGLGGLLVEQGTRFAISDLAWRMVDLDPMHDGPPVSACADLLARVAGDPADHLASRLATLVAHWHRNRLWAINLVPEMVLHDEAHAQAVDRNVALITEPLLVSGVLTAADVYHIALAAWLHDWGHASADTIGFSAHTDVETVPVTSGDVRDLHGLLTRQLLVGVPRTKQIHLLETDEAVWAGTLAAHHQGWTSCDNREPEGDRADTARRFQLPARSLAADVDYLAASIGIRRFRKQDAESLLRRVQELVALLRVADAADIGTHRVPHFDTMDAHLDMLSTIVEGHTQLAHADAKSSVECAEQRAAAYNDHLGKQLAYFTRHRSVGGVYPILQGEPHKWILAPQVRAAGPLTKVHDVDLLDPLTVVAEDVNRELGSQTDPQSDDWKAPVRNALARLGIDTRGVRYQMLSRTRAPVAGPAMSAFAKGSASV